MQDVVWISSSVRKDGASLTVGCVMETTIVEIWLMKITAKVSDIPAFEITLV